MRQREKYAELFAAEAREHLSEIGRALVALESDPSDGEPLAVVFRSVHTIKGMAAAMGYDVASKLAHNIETALDELRSGRRVATPTIVDLLLESSDVLEEAVEATVEGADPPDPARIIERLVLWRLNDDPSGDRLEDARPQRAQGSEGLNTALAEGGAEGSEGARGPGSAGRPSRRSDRSRVRVDIRRLDALMNLVGELTIVRNQLRASAVVLGSEPLMSAVERASRLIAEMQTHVVESRMVPMWQVFDRFPRLVRDAARSSDREVELSISGKDLELDRSLLDAISDPLVHLLRNAVDHGVEAPEEREAAGKPRMGRIELSARRERSRVVIVVRDDGRGIDRAEILSKARKEGLVAADDEPSDQELLRILARPGFTTAKQVTSLSGRGVGLNVVEDTIRSLGGSVAFESRIGAGTAFRIELPLTLAIARALMVSVSGQVYALPTTFTRESFEVPETALARSHGREWVSWRGEQVPVTRLRELFAGVGGNGAARSGKLRLVGVEFGGARLAVEVDRFIGEEEIVIKPFDPPGGTIPVFSGATVLADGRPALVLDVGNLL